MSKCECCKCKCNCCIEAFISENEEKIHLGVAAHNVFELLRAGPLLRFNGALKIRDYLNSNNARLWNEDFDGTDMEYDEEEQSYKISITYHVARK